MIQRIYEWKISGWRQWTDVSDISWSGVFSHNCAHFSKYFSKSIQIIFFFSVHNWSIFSQLYTLFKEFSTLKEFSQNCARPSKKTFCSCFPFLTYERLILPARNNSRMTFFPAQQLASDILDNLITPFRPMGPWVWWCGHSIAVGDDTLFNWQTSLLPRSDLQIVSCI